MITIVFYRRRMLGRFDVQEQFRHRAPMGTQIVGRDDPDLENMIGIFLNNLVMRFDASGDPAFDEFLTRVNGTVQDALIHQRMPFHKLVEVLNPPRDSQRPPLISLNFTVLRDVMDHKTYRSFDLHGQPSLSAGSLYDLFFSWCIGRMAGAWPWNSTLTCSNGALPSGCSNS